MYGTNIKCRQDGWPIRPATLPIVEIFPTLQGEGPFAGMPAIFVRFGGCNLKCFFCDTQFDSWEAVRLNDIVTQIEAVAEGGTYGLVVLTGGEPFLYDLQDLLLLLRGKGFHIQIETAGSLKPASKSMAKLAEDMIIYGQLSVVVSPKTGKIQDWFLENAMAYKYIVWDKQKVNKETGLPMESMQVSGGVRARIAAPPTGTVCMKVYIQPMDPRRPGNPDGVIEHDMNIRYAVALCKKFGYTLSLQQHKVLGLP